MMSNKERKERQRIRKKLREQGVLPPVKPRVNRKKYAEEIMQILHGDDRLSLYEIASVLRFFLPSSKDGKLLDVKITDEQMTALRIIHLANEDKLFKQRLSDQGRSCYNMIEWYNEVYCKVYPENRRLEESEKTHEDRL